MAFEVVPQTAKMHGLLGGGTREPADRFKEIRSSKLALPELALPTNHRGIDVMEIDKRLHYTQREKNYSLAFVKFKNKFDAGVPLFTFASDVPYERQKRDARALQRMAQRFEETHKPQRQPEPVEYLVFDSTMLEADPGVVYSKDPITLSLAYVIRRPQSCAVARRSAAARPSGVAERCVSTARRREKDEVDLFLENSARGKRQK